MKSSAFFLAVLMLTACSDKNSSTAINTRGDSLTATYYPFIARHDLGGSEANPQYAKKVLTIWKGFEAGNLKPYRSSFADSITFAWQDRIVTGPAEKVLEFYQKQREQLGTIQVFIEHWTPVYNKQRGEQWVMVWAQMDAQGKNGTNLSHAVQQVWKFNSSGKIYYMQQFRGLFQWP